LIRIPHKGRKILNANYAKVFFLNSLRFCEEKETFNLFYPLNPSNPTTTGYLAYARYDVLSNPYNPFTPQPPKGGAPNICAFPLQPVSCPKIGLHKKV